MIGRFFFQVVLQKRQQEAAKRHREYEQKMSREIQVRAMATAVVDRPFQFLPLLLLTLLLCGCLLLLLC